MDKGKKIKKTRVTLKKDRSYQIKAKVNKLKKKKKLMGPDHAPMLRYISSNRKIATVSRSGRITAKAKGSCKVYVIAANGAGKVIKVTIR